MHGEENIAGGDNGAEQCTQDPGSNSVNRDIIIVGWRYLEGDMTC
jgi:hypothetical protein